MPAAYRDSIKIHGSGNSISIDPASTDGGLTYSSGDVLLLHVWGVTSIAAPSGSDLTWTQDLTDTIVGPFSNTYCHKVYWAIADASISSFTIALGAADSYAACLTSISGADTGSPIDASAIATDLGSVSVNPIAPAVSPSGSDSLLVCAFGGHETGGESKTSTPPSGMTEREDWPTTSEFEHFSLATLALSASGSTGTKTFDLVTDLDTAEVYAASSVAVKSAAAGGATVSASVVAAVGAVGSPSITYNGPRLVADRGSTANTTAGTTTLVDLAAGASITVGNYLIARVSVDNSGSSGAATTLAVTDTRSNTWTVSTAANNDPGAAAAGVTSYYAYAKVENAYSDGDDITFTWGNSTTAKAVVIEEWAKVHSVTPIVVAATTATGSSTTPSISRTPTVAGQVFYGLLSVESGTADTYTEDADTTEGSWVSLTRAGAGTTTGGQTVAGAYKRVTGTSAQTWNPTLGTSRDWAQIAFVLNPQAGDATASPSVVAGVGAVGSASLVTNSIVTATVVAGVSAVGSPSLATGSGTDVSATAVAAVGAVGTPAMAMTAAPAAVAAVAAQPAAGISTGITNLLVGTVAATASVPTPSGIGPEGTLVYRDDFNVADGVLEFSDLTWSQEGNFSVISNQLGQSTIGAPDVARAQHDAATSNTYAQIVAHTLNSTSYHQVGAAVRVSTDLQTYYLMVHSGNGEWALMSVVAGVFTSLDSGTQTPSLPETIKVEAIGSNIRGYINGVQVGSATDTSIPTGTRGGVFIYNSDFVAGTRADDFEFGDSTSATVVPASVVAATASVPAVVASVGGGDGLLNLVQGWTTATTGGTTDTSLTSTAFDFSPSSGNTLLMAVTSTNTVSTPSGWTLVEQRTGTSLATYLFRRDAAGAATAFTVTPTVASAMAVSTAEYEGILVSSPVDDTGGATGTTTLASLGVDTTHPASLIVGAAGGVGTSVNGWNNPSSGFFERIDIYTTRTSGDDVNLSVISYRTTDSGTYSTSVTNTNATEVNGVIAAFRLDLANAQPLPTTVAGTGGVGAPTVVGNSDATVAATVVAAVAAVPLPTVVATGFTVVPPATVAAVATVNSVTSSVVVSTAVQPDVVAATSAVAIPSSIGDSTPTTNVQPTRVAAVAAVGTPTFVTGSSATITPVTVAAVASVGTPTLSLGTAATVSVSTVAAVAAVNSPAVTSSSVNKLVTRVAAVAAVGQVTIDITVPIYRFTTPYVSEGPLGLDSLLLVRMSLRRGVTVLKENGAYREVRYPTQEEVEGADIAYIGGHEHFVEGPEALELTNAGYGAYLEVVDE
jgi:hypothetical protein